MQALAALAEGKPAEAIPLLEPITFDARHADAGQHLDASRSAGTATGPPRSKA